MSKTGLLSRDGKGRLATLITRIVKVGLFLATVALVFLAQKPQNVRSLFKWSGNKAAKEWPSADGDAVKSWRWNEVEPSSDLERHPCYDAYDCARLDLQTFCIRGYNATDRANYKGPVFINPGGPGGSGVWFVKHLGPYYQMVVGKNHDIISFDPRGIGATTPSVSCWNSSSIAEFLWSMSAPPVLDAYSGALNEAYADATAFLQQCFPYVEEIGKYLKTASVARDMLHIVEKMEHDKIRYWGFSYGTYIGATFAALFPDKIERMVNDGNVDAVEFAAGTSTHFVSDTDKVMDAFYAFCHKSGPELCAYHDASPAAIEKRLDALLGDIKIHPVIVAAPSANARPEIVTYSRVQKLLSASLYQPLVVFPLLAESLAGLEKGDGRPFLKLTSQGELDVPLCDAGQLNPQDPTPEIPELEGSADGGLAVLCSDSEPLRGGVEGFAAYLTLLEGISKAAGASMAGMALGCDGWGVRAKWRFNGPFEGNTSHPILFIANTADNVTPLYSAQQNAKGFPGSVVMIQDSYGHTSLSAPSKCTVSKVHTYFQTGELPPPNTICAPDLMPFERWNMTGLLRMTADQIDVEVAMRMLMMAPVPGSKLNLRR